MVVRRPVLEWARLQRWRLTEEARGSRGRCRAKQWRGLGEGGGGLGGGGGRRAAVSVRGRVLQFDLRGGRRAEEMQMFQNTPANKSKAQ